MAVRGPSELRGAGGDDIVSEADIPHCDDSYLGIEILAIAKKRDSQEEESVCSGAVTLIAVPTPDHSVFHLS